MAMPSHRSTTGRTGREGPGGSGIPRYDHSPSPIILIVAAVRYASRVSGSDETRDLLRAGDALAKSGKHREALVPYVEAARTYTAKGFALKAVAVYVQVRRLVREHALDAHDVDAEARAQLIVLYRQLGLVADALELERENREMN
jgi:hypothetical protein